MLSVAVAGSLATNNRAVADDALVVSLIEPVDNAQYPDMAASLSVVDVTSGRPVPRLEPGGVVMSDDSGRLEVLALKPAVLDKAPVAYSLLLDTGGAMAPHVDAARRVLSEVISGLGPNDLVRIVKFNDGTDEQGTNWVRRDDPNLAAQIEGWQATDRLSLVVPALVKASEVARQAPQGYERHATVAFLSVDGARGEPGMSLDSIAQVPTVTFTFGFGTPQLDQEALPFFLEDLASQRGGAYWPVDSAKYTGNGPAILKQAMHTVWALSFRADGLPDGASHRLRLEVRDELQRAGTLEDSYMSGTLLDVSPLKIDGLANAERVSGDRRLSITPGGEKQWVDWKLELFRNCAPGMCSPSAESANASLNWRLLVGHLDQGNHTLYLRLTASDRTRTFSDVQTLRFTRVGTGWNLWTPTAVLGVALAASAAVVGLARRSSNRSVGAKASVLE